MNGRVSLIDTHCHIDLPAFDADRPEVMSRARSRGVTGMILIGFSPERWETCRRLVGESENAWMSVGLHPTEAARFNDDLFQDLQAATTWDRVVAIGETGLDNFWDASAPEQQRIAFEAQIRLAKENELPFIVHQRDAEAETLDVLRSSSPPHHGVLHCYTSDRDYLTQALDLGMYIGIGGALTFKSRLALREAAAHAPIDRIVLETDAPYMAPEPHRGTRNEPACLRVIAERFAELRGMTVEDVARQTTANARRLFRVECSSADTDWDFQ